MQFHPRTKDNSDDFVFKVCSTFASKLTLTIASMVSLELLTQSKFSTWKSRTFQVDVVVRAESEKLAAIIAFEKKEQDFKRY